jgi:hypothetical protein
MTEGVDWSMHEPGTPGSRALNALGKHFACIYLPTSNADERTNTQAELNELIAGHIEIVAILETNEDQLRTGLAGGKLHAQMAQHWLDAYGLPATQPVYFTGDDDYQPNEQTTVNDYLDGASSVIGRTRVGLYGGINLLTRCYDDGTASWFWQTTAWSYGEWFPHCHLQQYGYGAFINGVECDLDRAMVANYGQASLFVSPTTDYAPPVLPDWYARAEKQANPSIAVWEGNKWYPQRANVRASVRTYQYPTPEITQPWSGPPIDAGNKLAVRWMFSDADKHVWYVNDNGYHYAAKFEPQLRFPKG